MCKKIINKFSLHYQEEKQIEKQREKDFEAEAMKTTIEKTDQRILLYADEVLEESKGVRPLYPIVKAIKVRLNISNVGSRFPNNYKCCLCSKECKEQMGLASLRKVEETVRAERPKRKHGVRRAATKFVPPDQIYYF